ncbi:protein involved in gliding motility GldI [Dokdonia sp. Hel_I_63]|uniref:gliding motility-associated peptidyl-prolyl isomerase GldI n=1 Tax=unclassified Dokdonia TaxID=2615033 RepID=UPI00020A66A1|nr:MULTISPECIES: gliding motility-associated peptidyl-prolyl isomerase GldI [unclassified Dokdonia]AEE20086.1 peptidyl-prolyl isomerase, gliding motility-associated [Dokdonia sp. 4H-3-7-5]TVZ23659.1 protein involved in gliding motility GldI [Dokdonia sp. Hel_I_63]
MRNLIFLFSIFLIVSCSETVARRPVSQKTGSYVKTETISRNKELIAQDEAAIKKFIASDTLNIYNPSPNGFWYSYIAKDTLGKQAPQVGDLVLFNYNLATINGKELVTQEELGNTVTQIDQSNPDIITGIREGLKLMKEGETMTFLFPSYKAYGYYGFEDRIPSNTPVRSTVTLLEIKDQSNE